MKTPSIRSVDIEVRRERVLSAAVPLDLHILNTLTQVRQHLHESETDELAESILTRGQHVPGRVAALRPVEAGKYVREINELFSSKHRLRDMKKVLIDDQEFYLFLIYGHRRLAGCRRAWHLLTATERTNTRFDGTYLCDIHFGLTIHDIIPMQLIENQHVQVPKQEEVAAMWRYWRYLQRHNGGTTIAAFAKRIGRKPEHVREMLRFTKLPNAVQERVNPNVQNGPASFGLLLEVARLVEAHERVEKPLAEDEVVSMVDYLIAKRITAREFAKEVSDRIAFLYGKQLPLFAYEPISREVVRKTAAAGLINAVISQLHYMQVIHDMMRSDSFGKLSPYWQGSIEDGGGAEYSPHSPARMALRMADELRRIIPDLAHMIERDGKSRRRLDEALHDVGITYAVFMASLGGDE